MEGRNKVQPKSDSDDEDDVAEDDAPGKAEDNLDTPTDKSNAGE